MLELEKRGRSGEDPLMWAVTSDRECSSLRDDTPEKRRVREEWLKERGANDIRC